MKRILKSTYTTSSPSLSSSSASSLHSLTGNSTPNDAPLSPNRKSHQERFAVKATKNYKSTKEGELSFSKGAKIRVMHIGRDEKEGWLLGIVEDKKNKSGWFPSSYVKNFDIDNINNNINNIHNNDNEDMENVVLKKKNKSHSISSVEPMLSPSRTSSFLNLNAKTFNSFTSGTKKKNKSRRLSKKNE